MMTSSSRMGIIIKEEHLLDGVSAMMISELQHHFNHYFIFKAVYATCSYSSPYSLVLDVRALTPCILTPSYFLTEHDIKQNKKPASTPPPTVISAMDNYSFPPF